MGSGDQDRPARAGATAPLPDRSAGEAGPVILPGTRYQLDHLLGDGGAGQVYRGVHLELQRPVAIKVLHAEISFSSDYAARFRREARIASAIRHPGVVAVSDFGTADDGRLFLVMELIEGQTLAEVVRRGPLRPSRAFAVAANLCDVLAAIHAAGIVHRDIKPANVFVLDDDTVKVVDFGIARVGLLGVADSKITRTGKVVGTPGYMAPEHARAQEVDGRADLYSVGAVLYEMLTGLPPFRGESPVDVLMAQLTTRPEPPSALVRANGGPRVPRAADRLVRRLLAVKPADRHRTAGEVAAELRAIAARLGPTTSASVAAMPPRPRLRGVAVAVATAAALGVGLAAGLWGLGLVGPGARCDGAAASAVAAAAAKPPAPAPSPPAAADGRQTPDPAPAAADGGQTPDPAPAARPPSSTAHAAGVVPPAPQPDAALPPRRPTPAGAATPSARGAAPAGPAAGGGAARELIQQARIAAASGRYAEAERLYEAARQAGADQASVLAGLGQVALAQGQHERAISLLQRALGARPGSTRLQLDLGRAFRGAGQTARAIEQWRAVLAREPGNAQARALLRSVGAE